MILSIDLIFAVKWPGRPFTKSAERVLPMGTDTYVKILKCLAVYSCKWREKALTLEEVKYISSQNIS